MPVRRSCVPSGVSAADGALCVLESGPGAHALVRGVPHDRDLLHFDAKYETARNPAEWLWGPGSGRDAVAWLAREHPPDDEVDLLDRIFLLRYHAPLLYLPRNPDLAL